MFGDWRRLLLNDIQFLWKPWKMTWTFYLKVNVEINWGIDITWSHLNGAKSLNHFLYMVKSTKRTWDTHAPTLLCYSIPQSLLICLENIYIFISALEKLNLSLSFLQIAATATVNAAMSNKHVTWKYATLSCDCDELPDVKFKLGDAKS